MESHQPDDEDREGRSGGGDPPEPSAAAKQLAGLIVKLHYGHIDSLLVVLGEPRWDVFVPQIKQVRVFTEHEQPKRPSLKQHVSQPGPEFHEFFRCLRTIELALVNIVVQHGHPIRVVIHHLFWR